MKTRNLAAFWIITATLPVFADKFVMKDGSTVEGAILREDATNYVVEVKITKSIKDERTLAKADVVKVERERADQTAFQAIAAYIPSPDNLTADEYALRIRNVEKFLTEYKVSTKTNDAKAILSKLKAEANEILAGGVKVNGTIIPPAEYRTNAYEIDSRIQEAKIRTLVKETKYLAALRTFSDFSRDFRNTTAHSEVVPLITQVIKTYVAETTQSIATYDARVKEREVGLQRMSAADRKVTENAIREETAELGKRHMAEKAAKISWVTPEPFLKATLDETVNFGKQELARLATAGSPPAVDAGKAYRVALGVILNNGDTAAVTAAITAAKTAQVAPKYIAILESAGKASGAIK